MSECIFLVGVPGSGKSTYLETAFDYIRNDEDVVAPYVVISNEIYMIFSTDGIIENLAIAAGCTYDEIFKDAIKVADRIFMHMIKSSADAGISMIIDRTNLSYASRMKIINHIKPNEYRYSAKVFIAPEKNEWERRLANRPGKTIPDNILQSMKNSFQMPTIAEGFSSVEIISNA